MEVWVSWIFSCIVDFPEQWEVPDLGDKKLEIYGSLVTFSFSIIIWLEHKISHSTSDPTFQWTHSLVCLVSWKLHIATSSCYFYLLHHFYLLYHSPLPKDVKFWEILKLWEGTGFYEIGNFRKEWNICNI